MEGVPDGDLDAPGVSSPSRRSRVDTESARTAMP